jgi:hypothetical protein
MSKKATRRAAREAFPKAKVPVSTKSSGRSSGGKYTSKAARQKATVARGAPGLKPPSWKRSLIIGLGLGVAYFLMTHYWQKDKLNIWGELLISFLGFVFFTLISYFTDKWTYERRKKKLQGSGK